MERDPRLCQTKALSPDIKWKAFLPDTEQTHESEVAVVHGDLLNLDNHTIKNSYTMLLALDRIHRIVLEDDLTTKSSYDMTQYPGNIALISLFHSGKPLPSIVHLLMDKKKRSDFAVWLIMMLRRIDKHTADWEQTIGQLQHLTDSRMPFDFSDTSSSRTCLQRRVSMEYCSSKSIERKSERIKILGTSTQKMDDCCNETERSAVFNCNMIRYRSPSLNTKDIAAKLIQSTWTDSCEREINVGTPSKCVRFGLSDDGFINTDTFQRILTLTEIQELYVGKRSETLQAMRQQESNGKYFSIIAHIGSRRKIFDFEVCDKSVRRRVIQQITRKLVEMDLMDPKHRRKVLRSILALDKDGWFSFHIRSVSDEQERTNTESISELYCTSDSLKEKEIEFECGCECECDTEKNRDERINPRDEVTKFDVDKDVIIAAKEVALEDMEQMVQRLNRDNECLRRNIEEERHKSKANDREHLDVTRDLKISGKVMQKRVCDVLKQNASLRKHSEEVAAEKQSLKRELDSKKKEMQRLRCDFENNLKEGVVKEQRLRGELKCKGRDMQHLQNEFDDLYKSHEAKLNRLSEVTKQNERLRKRSNEIAARQQCWKKKLESMKRDMQMRQRDFENDLREGTAKQLSLRRELQSKERDRQQLQSQVANFNDKVTSLENVNKQNECLRKDLKESAAAQQRLRRESDSKEKDLNHLQYELEKYKGIEQTCVAELERVKSLFDKQKQETRALSVHINAQNGEIGTLRQNKEKLMAEVKSLRCSMIHNESLENELRQSKLKWSRVIEMARNQMIDSKLATEPECPQSEGDKAKTEWIRIQIDEKPEESRKDQRQDILRSFDTLEETRALLEAKQMKLNSERLEIERQKEEMERNVIQEQKLLGTKMRRLEQLKRDLENERIDIQDERDKLAVEREELDSVRLELEHRREEILRDEQRLKEESEKLTGIALRHEINLLRNEVTTDSFNDKQDEVKSDASDKNVEHQPAQIQRIRERAINETEMTNQPVQEIMQREISHVEAHPVAPKHTGIIQCRDMSARNLPKADKLSESDPYVVLSNNSGESAQTQKMMNNGEHPIWNEQLTLSANANEPISIRIYDWNKIIAHPLLCSMTIDIGSICKEGKEILLQVAMDADKQYEKQNKKPSFSCTLLYTKI